MEPTRQQKRMTARAFFGAAQRSAVFTSVDGTLIDARTFDPGRSRAAVRRLLDANVPVIPVSQMTLAELAPIANDLGLRSAMIIEAGGAIARWKHGAWEVEPCGAPADILLDAVREIEERSGASLLVYSALGEVDAAQLSGRTGAMLHASTQREYSEPFIIERGRTADVIRAASSIGYSVRRGTRFLHLCRECDEGEAFARLREELRCDVAIGIGSSLLDADFMQRSEVPIIVPIADSEIDRGLLAAVPNAHIASWAGPRGWAAAVDEVLSATARRSAIN